MIKKLLFLDDDRIYFKKIYKQIEDLFEVCYVQNVEIAIRELQKTFYDIVVIDRHIIKGNGDIEDGLDVAKEIAENPNFYLNPEVFVISGIRKSREDKLEAYNVAAKNCFMKPEEDDMFVAVLKQLSPSFDSDTKKALYYYTVEYDLRTHEVRDDGKEVKLSAVQCFVLKELIKHQGYRMPKNKLEKMTYGTKRLVSDNTLSTTICRMRQQIPIIDKNLDNKRFDGYLLRKEEVEKR